MRGPKKVTHLTHVCQTCGRDASFGYGVSLRKGEPGRWFCFVHRPAEPQHTPQPKRPQDLFGKPVR